MADDPTNDPKTPEGDEGKTFTQAELDRIIADRLKREASKYADYDELKAKADKFDEHEAANKSEVDKLREQVETLTKSQTAAEAKALRAEVAMAKGLTDAQAKRLSGSTREELEADADELVEMFKGQGNNPPPSNRPKPNLAGGSDPTEVPEETDPKKLAESVPPY